MPPPRLPEEWLLRIDRELGQRSAVAAFVQALGFLLLRAFLARAGAVTPAVEVAGLAILTMMAARIALYAVQRKSYPGKLTRARWTLLFRVFFGGGGLAWGGLTAAILQSSGIGYPFFIALLLNVGICALAAQNVGLDLLLVRVFAVLILGPPLALALLHPGRPGYLLLGVLTLLFLIYQQLLARRSHAMLVEALENRGLIEAKNDQLSALVEAIPGFVLWTDAQSTALGMNQRARTELREEATGTLAQEVLTFLTSGAEDAFAERTLPTLAGERSHLLAFRRWRTLRGDRVVLTALDIEAQKAAQREAEEARMHALESARLGALGTMAAGIAHEINNPLQVLRYATGRLRRQLYGAGDLEGLCAPILQRVDRTVDRMASIVAGLRSFARDGQADPVEPVNVDALVREVTELVRISRAADDTQLRVGPVPPELVLACRRTEIGQVLVNLLANAFDAVKPLRERWVELQVHDAGDQVELCVTDSGRGIPPELLGKIMVPFFTTKAGAGTGLGLSISRSIVERHQGSLAVDPRHPNTRFVVRLPRVLPPDSPARPSSVEERH